MIKMEHGRLKTPKFKSSSSQKRTQKTDEDKREMDRNPGRLIEQLQSVQARQRRIIQQLQAENARRLSDLADVRQERDAFRKEAARVRKENAELYTRLEEVWTEYQDLKRGRATLARTAVAASHAHGRNANVSFKILNTLSVLSEEHNESTTTEGAAVDMEKAQHMETEPYLLRALPEPLNASLESSQNHSVSTVVTPRNNSKAMPSIQTALRGGQSTML